MSTSDFFKINKKTSEILLTTYSSKFSYLFISFVKPKANTGNIINNSSEFKRTQMDKSICL